MMGDLIIVFVKSPSIPAQGVLGDYIDRCIMVIMFASTKFCHGYGANLKKYQTVTCKDF